MKTLYGHSETITSCSFTPSGKLIASISDDHSLKIWSIKQETPLQTIKTTKKKNFHSGPIVALSFHTTKDLIATGSMDKTFCLSNYKKGTIYSKSGEIGDIETICVGSCFDAVCVGTLDGVLRVFDISKGLVVADYQHDCGVIETRFWEANRLFVSCTTEGDLVFNGSGRNKDFRVQPVIRGGFVHDFDFLDEFRVLLAGEDGVLYVYDLRKGVMM